MIQILTFSVIEQLCDKYEGSREEILTYYSWDYLVFCPSQLLMVYGIWSSVKQAYSYESYEVERRKTLSEMQMTPSNNNESMLDEAERLSLFDPRCSLFLRDQSNYGQREYDHVLT